MDFSGVETEQDTRAYFVRLVRFLFLAFFFFGLHGSRSVDSSPSCLAVFWGHRSVPCGRPRFRLSCTLSSISGSIR
jgi:hypothetical protein